MPHPLAAKAEAEGPRRFARSANHALLPHSEGTISEKTLPLAPPKKP